MNEAIPEIVDRPQLLAYLTRRGKPACIIMVGAPGSGKTTLAEAWEQLGITVVSLDRLLLQKPYLIHILDRLQAEMNDLFGKALKNGGTLVEDNLNIDRAERQRLSKLALQSGFEPVLVFMDAPLDLCLRQNRQREPLVPDATLEQLWRDMQNDRPDASEGEVYRLTPITEENRYRVERVTMVNAVTKSEPWWKRIFKRR